MNELICKPCSQDIKIQKALSYYVPYKRDTSLPKVLTKTVKTYMTASDLSCPKWIKGIANFLRHRA